MDFPIGLKKSAVMTILRCEDQYLLLKRKREPHIGKYAPVGGKIDPYESPPQTAIRETREETGIDISELHYCGTIVETSPVKYNWICFIYLADIQYQTPPPCNEGTLEWIHFDDLLKIPTPPTDWYIYKYVAEQKRFAFRVEFDEQLNILEMVEEISGEKLIG